jgi:hypothetical protein
MRGLKCGHALSLLGNTFSGMLMETDVLFMRATCVFFLWSTKFISPCHEFLPSLSQRLDQNLECSAGFMPQTHATLCCFSLCTGDAENICANCFGTKLMMIQQIASVHSQRCIITSLPEARNECLWKIMRWIKEADKSRQCRQPTRVIHVGQVVASETE